MGQPSGIAAATGWRPAAVVVGLLWLALLLLWPRTPQQTALPDPAPPPSDTPQGTGIDQDSGPAARLWSSPDLASSLNALRTELSPAAWRRLRQRVDDACVVPVLLRLEGRREPDPRRDPARDALLARCQGLPQPSLYRPGIDVRAERSDSWPLPSATEARRRLREARDGAELVAAWLDAYLVDALPQEEIFSDGRRLLPADAEQVIQVVRDWRECAARRACGSDSLLTLKVCAQYGCSAGADLLQAWHEALSPRDFSTAQAVHRWLLTEVPVDAD